MVGNVNLEAALGLSTVRLSVFPVRIAYNASTERWDKRPFITGWQDRATTVESAIHEFGCLYPQAVPGIALGCAGLVVLDADRHGGPDGVSAFQALVTEHGLPEGCVKVNTAGSGEHWIFRNLDDDPLGNAEGVLPGGINMRGRGGFIVAPGAVRPDGRGWSEPEDGPKLIDAFREGTLPEIPRWLVELIRSGPKEQRSPFRFDASRREQAYAAAALEGEVTKVAIAASGSRNNTLFKAAAALGSMVSVGWIEAEIVQSRLLGAAATCGLVRDDGAHSVRATIASGLKAGMATPHPPLEEKILFGNFGHFGTTSEEPWGEPDMFYLGSGRSKPVPFPPMSWARSGASGARPMLQPDTCPSTTSLRLSLRALRH
jgi:Bifunctional DNA primase/polymerase, N-terminal